MSRFRHDLWISKGSRVSPLQLSRLINAEDKNQNEVVELTELDGFEINALTQQANYAFYA